MSLWVLCKFMNKGSTKARTGGASSIIKAKIKTKTRGSQKQKLK